MLTVHEKIYLDDPIMLSGIKVGHTLNGLHYLIDHFTHCMNISSPKQMSDEDRKHCEKMIDNYKIHISLYEREEQLKTQSA